MGHVNGQPQRDMAIYRAWVDGARQSDLATQYGVEQPAISKAVGRVLDQYPAPDRAAEVRRAVDLCDDLLGVYVPKARAGHAASSREARGWLQLKAKWLGIDRREVHVEHGGYVEHAWVPGPTVAEVLDPILAQGRIRPRAELERLDQ